MTTGAHGVSTVVVPCQFAAELELASISIPCINDSFKYESYLLPLEVNIHTGSCLL